MNVCKNSGDCVTHCFSPQVSHSEIAHCGLDVLVTHQLLDNLDGCLLDPSRSKSPAKSMTVCITFETCALGDTNNDAINSITAGHSTLFISEYEITRDRILEFL